MDLFQFDLSEPITPFFGQRIFGNTLQTWVLALAIFLLTVVVLRILKGFATNRLHRWAQKTTTALDDAWISVLDTSTWFAYLAAGAAVARRVVRLDRGSGEFLTSAIFILLGIQGALWLQQSIQAFLEIWAKREGTNHSSTAAGAIRFVCRIIIWTALLLVVLSSLGIELTSIVAGLGVGGVAAALAVQKVLGDLFAGLSMYFDRPFDIGDFIIVGDVLGTVTKIGLRTTRIDSLGGEKIVYPNGELASQCIRNYYRMQERRVVFHFGIEYNLPADKVALARDIAEEVIKKQEGVRFDRAHFKEYGEYSLTFEVVYYVLSADYTEYMNKQHDINLGIYRRFEEENIPFAFPTRTLHIRRETEGYASA